MKDPAGAAAYFGRCHGGGKVSKQELKQGEQNKDSEKENVPAACQCMPPARRALLRRVQGAQHAAVPGSS